MRVDVNQTGHYQPIRAVHDTVAFAVIFLADEGDAIFGHHDVDARSVDMRLSLVIPHDREATVSDQRCRHLWILVVPQGRITGHCLRRPQGYAQPLTTRNRQANDEDAIPSSRIIGGSRARDEIPRRSTCAQCWTYYRVTTWAAAALINPQKRLASIAATIASGASSWTRCPASLIRVSGWAEINDANASPLAIGIQSSRSPQSTVTRQSSGR